MANESRQHWLKRNRKPRVHITMDVEKGDAKEQVELPFIVGVLGDFSGHPLPEDVKDLRERKFTTIDRDNFGQIMKAMKPRLEFKVENTLTGEGEIPVELGFESMDDFSPAAVAKQVKPLEKLLETRDRLMELQSQVDRSPELDNLLAEVMEDEAKMNKLSTEVGGEEPDTTETGD